MLSHRELAKYGTHGKKLRSQNNKLYFHWVTAGAHTVRKGGRATRWTDGLLTLRQRERIGLWVWARETYFICNAAAFFYFYLFRYNLFI